MLDGLTSLAFFCAQQQRQKSRKGIRLIFHQPLAMLYEALPAFGRSLRCANGVLHTRRTASVFLAKSGLGWAAGYTSIRTGPIFFTNVSRLSNRTVISPKWRLYGRSTSWARTKFSPSEYCRRKTRRLVASKSAADHLHSIAIGVFRRAVKMKSTSCPRLP